jgi:hypothetical protein
MTVNGHADKGDEWSPMRRVFATRAGAGTDTTEIARGHLLPAGLLGGAELTAVILAQRFPLATAELLAAFGVRGVLAAR